MPTRSGRPDVAGVGMAGAYRAGRERDAVASLRAAHGGRLLRTPCAAKGTISAIYLGDAVVELGRIAGWRRDR